MALKASELMQQMMDAGAPMEAVVIALRAIEDAQSELEAKRAAARERKRRQRAKAQDAERDEDVTVTGQSQDSHGTSPHPLPLSPQTPQTPTPAPVENTRAREADKFPCPEWCDPAVWRDLKANRRTKRLTNTPTAHKRFVEAIEAMADEHWPPGRLVEAIAAKGWGGPHDPREARKPNNDNRKQANSGRNTADLARQKLGLA